MGNSSVGKEKIRGPYGGELISTTSVDIIWLSQENVRIYSKVVFHSCT